MPSSGMQSKQSIVYIIYIINKWKKKDIIIIIKHLLTKNLINSLLSTIENFSVLEICKSYLDLILFKFVCVCTRMQIHGLCMGNVYIFTYTWPPEGIRCCFSRAVHLTGLAFTKSPTISDLPPFGLCGHCTHLIPDKNADKTDKHTHKIKISTPQF